MQVACNIRLETLDKGYNFASDLISIGGLHAKLWAFKVMEIPSMGILRLPRQNDIWMLVP